MTRARPRWRSRSAPRPTSPAGPSARAPLYVVAVGLILAVLARLARGAADGAPGRAAAHRCRRRRSRATTSPVRVELELESALAPAGVTLVERYARLGERRTQLRPRRAPPLGALRARGGAARPLPHRAGRRASSRIRSGSSAASRASPRARVARRLPAARRARAAVLRGRRRTRADGRRLLLQRPTGFDLHSVRDYVRRRLAAQGALAHRRRGAAS